MYSNHPFVGHCGGFYREKLHANHFYVNKTEYQSPFFYLANGNVTSKNFMKNSPTQTIELKPVPAIQSGDIGQRIPFLNDMS